MSWLRDFGAALIGRPRNRQVRSGMAAQQPGWRDPGPPDLPRASLPLRAIDRCDRCGARAVVRATRLMSVLLFCGHDANDHAKALTDAGWHVDQPGVEPEPKPGSIFQPRR